MKGILIDPSNKTVRWVDVNSDDAIRPWVESPSGFESMLVGESLVPDKKGQLRAQREYLYMDDEGMCRAYPNPFGYFRLSANGQTTQPFAGKALILGVNPEGESVPTGLTVERVQESVRWVELSIEEARKLTHVTVSSLNPDLSQGEEIHSYDAARF